jgi:outer membrane protein assembly factor BamB
MSKQKGLAIIVAVVVSLMSVNVFGGSGGDYWPMWRGPDGTGAARKGNPPITWSETENIKWKVDVPGESLSSPIIWGNKIFFQTAIKTEKKVDVKQEDDSQQDQSGGRRRRGSPPPTNIYKFDIVCMDRSNGKILWQKTVREELPHEGHHDTASFANYSPVTDGKYLWTSFGSRGVHCYDIDGNHKWSKELSRLSTRGSFGEGSSPALAGDAVIVVCDHEGDSEVFAFNKETGELIWKKARDESTSWATPVAVEVDGRTQVIINATNFIRSYDAKTGDIIWQCSGQTGNVIPTPVIGFDMVFCMSGFRGSAFQAIKLGKTGDLSGTDAVVWEMSDGTAYVPSQLLLGDKLFFCADSRNAGLVSCYDAKTGKAHYMKQRLDGVDTIYSSLVGVGDRVYVAARNGIVVALKNSDELEVLATNKLDDGFDATPAIVGDELYLKGKEHFYCIAKP